MCSVQNFSLLSTLICEFQTPFIFNTFFMHYCLHKHTLLCIIIDIKCPTIYNKKCARIRFGPQNCVKQIQKEQAEPHSSAHLHEKMQ